MRKENPPFFRTDKLIQATIRRHFGDCTVLTVAHRLNTILDSDRIMVLEAGNIVEFDTPARLYENTAGAFRKLVDDAGLNFERFSRT
jgi:ABC-type multidrug transport system fused ATPase/permease subunit